MCIECLKPDITFDPVITEWKIQLNEVTNTGGELGCGRNEFVQKDYHHNKISNSEIIFLNLNVWSNNPCHNTYIIES